jgi:outer membrane receptor for ferrienterochelin and colicins
MKLRLLLAVVAVSIFPLPVAAQPLASVNPGDRPPAQDDLSLQQLLAAEVVSTASKFPQEVREAPAAITIVTAEEIRRYGHRTLADVLRSVRGLYTTYDRNYSYIGVRGFARPGDYNTRVLLLIDGQRVNDAVYDMAPIGTDFLLDVSLIDRVEVIRGPGSSLYGTSAFFAVINVITRSGGQQRGVRADVVGGTLGAAGATVSYGRQFGGSHEFLLSAAAQRSDGADLLTFPVFAGIGSGAVEARGLDRDSSSGTFGSIAIGRLAVRGAFVSRRKHVPTAAFDTVLGDDRFVTDDHRGYLHATYDGTLGRGWLGTARAAYDHYGYQGVYPYDYGLPQAVVQWDAAESQSLSGELTARRRVGRAHLVSVGAEVRRQLQNRMWTLDEMGGQFDVSRPATIVGVYAQDEIRLNSWALVNAGLRLDRYPSFGAHVTPRAGLVLLPRPATAVKLLYGRAFRAPNPYELYYYPPPDGGELRPETIRSSELVWEESLSTRVRSSLSLFTYDVSDILQLRTFEPIGFEEPYAFANEGHVRARGIESEVELRLTARVSARASHAFVRTRHRATNEIVSNSPQHLTKMALQLPLAPLTLGLEGHYVGARTTTSGERLPGFFLQNVIVTAPAHPRVEISVGVYNAFDVSYADPGAEEHRQPSIPQDGRTVQARLRIGF